MHPPKDAEASNKIKSDTDKASKKKTDNKANEEHSAENNEDPEVALPADGLIFEVSSEGVAHLKKLNSVTRKRALEPDYDLEFPGNTDRSTNPPRKKLALGLDTPTDSAVGLLVASATEIFLNSLVDASENNTCEQLWEDLATQIKDFESSKEEVPEIPYLECQCCFDEIPFDETIECGKELHTFCKDCVIKSCEVALGDGNCFVKCMAAVDCTEVFPNATLAPVLPPQVFQKMEELQQIAEVAKAKIEGLENCPFCEFAYVPPDGTVFQCMKQGCLKASCRLCKQDSHVPLRCDEVVKEQDVRQKIENAMTEKLLRQCYQCGKSYVKLDGCNKIACTCGAVMCYLCQKPVTDYKHFNGQGGDEVWKCPLWSDTDVLHVQEVQNAGRQIRDAELTKQPGLTLTYDPTQPI